MSENSETLMSPNLNSIDRREILKLGLAGMLASIVPLSFSTDAVASGNVWRVGFHHAHTGESFNGVYRIGNKYLPDAFDLMNYVLRDFRTGEIFPMDPRVIDIMAMIQRKADARNPIKIYSGYRSPKTNNRLRKNSSGVAKNSFHMYGQALDLHIDHYSTSKLRNIAKSLRAGGVGYYPKSQFIHVDTGAVRSW